MGRVVCMNIFVESQSSTLEIHSIPERHFLCPTCTHWHLADFDEVRMIFLNWMSYSCQQDFEESIHTKFVTIGWIFCEIWLFISFACKIWTCTLGALTHFIVINYCLVAFCTCRLLTAQSTLQCVTLTPTNVRVMFCSDTRSNLWVIADKLAINWKLP